MLVSKHMPADPRSKVEEHFKKYDIPYRLYEHVAVFTVDDVHRHAIHTDGVVGSKNLFLTNLEHKRFFLYTLPDYMRADLKTFAEKVGEKKVQFGSPEELMKYLGLTPGSVSLCGLLNDKDKNVEVYVHEVVYEALRMHLHPNINTASMELTHDALMKYFESLGRDVSVVRDAK